MPGLHVRWLYHRKSGILCRWRGPGDGSRTVPVRAISAAGLRPAEAPAKSYGYYRVEPRYYGQRWQRGHYLPSSYRSYYVRDPYAYNLRPAPRGYRYVHAGNDIVLIAIATGLIASVLSGVY